MRVTEEEAKEKLCPLIQRNCVGKGCMAFIGVGNNWCDETEKWEDTYRCGMALGGR